jgi:hypothetical protein
MMKYIFFSGLIALIFALFRKKSGAGGQTTSQSSLSGEIEFKEVLQGLKNSGYDLTALRFTEKMFRLETGHLTANIYRKTNGAGAIAVKNERPYGFTVLKNNPDIKTTGTYLSSNGYNYIKFATLKDGVKFVYEYITNGNMFEQIKRYGGGQWYLDRVKTIKPKYTL